MGFKTMLCVLCTAMAAAGAELQRNQCNDTQFWNNEIGQCLDCNMCKEFPKMPSCDTCLKMEDPSPNMWKVVALVSFSLIAVLAVLMIGVLVHHCKSEKNKPLREPIEETAGPLYAAV